MMKKIVVEIENSLYKKLNKLSKDSDYDSFNEYIISILNSAVVFDENEVDF